MMSSSDDAPGRALFNSHTVLALIMTDVSTDLQDEISGAVLTGSYLTMFVNCMLWLLYGLPWVHPNSTLVITINGTGFFMEVVYLMLFIIYLKTKKEKIKLLFIMLVELRFVGILALMVPKLAHTYKLRSNIVGSICMAGNIMTYACMLLLFLSRWRLDWLWGFSLFWCFY